MGYASSNRALLSALESQGVEIADDAETALWYGYAGRYEPTPGKTNVLFTMFESPVLPEEVRSALQKPDLILVPSRFCADAFRKETDVPIEICPLGVNLDRFKPSRHRRRKKEPFRWLYVGAPNYRKLTIVPEIYQALFRRMEGVELYIKLTGADDSETQKQELLSLGGEEVEPGVYRGRNAVVDNRFLPEHELRSLYASAHGFLFLHCGEGWGLTGLEAMATGLPLVVTDYSGVQEYITPDSCWPVPASFGPLEALANTGEIETQWVGWPSSKVAVEAITEIMLDPEEARRRGKRAARRAREFSWSQAGSRLCEILSAHGML